MRPGQRLAVDILFQKPLAHHQAEIAPRAPPRHVGRLVDDVPEIVQPAGERRLHGLQPGFARMPALPGPGGEAQNLHLDAAPFQGARQNVGATGGDHDRASAHRAGIVEQQRDDRVAELGVALLFEGQRMHGVDDDARQARGIERALVEIEIPAAILLREQAALQPVGQPRDRALKRHELLVEERAQPVEFLGVAQFLGGNDLVELLGEDLVAERGRVIEDGQVGAPGIPAAR